MRVFFACFRAAYLALPLPNEVRLRWKSRIFSFLAPVIKHTYSYARWVAFEAQRRESTRQGPTTVSNAAKQTPESLPPPTWRSVPEEKSLRTYVAQTFAAQNKKVTQTFEEFTGVPSAKIVCFYLPQFHPFPENDAWWGKGFTEWTNVTKARPQFVDHYQPRLPSDLGFYDLRLPEVMDEQIALAKRHGIHGFCFHYYWFSGRRLLERPLDQYMESGQDFPFCLCWANENWTRRWDGFDNEILIGQEYGEENDIEFIKDASRYFKHPAYMRVNGRPLLLIYRASILPDARRSVETWRHYCLQAGIENPYLVMVQFDVEDPSTYGFDAAVEFPPHKIAKDLNPINHDLQIINPDYKGHVVSYDDAVEAALSWPVPTYPLIRGVFPSWDNEARKPGSGYTFHGSTPEKFGKWLDGAIDFARKHPVEKESLVFVNAWNEWAEGAHLEPDRQFGSAYLQQVANSLGLSSTHKVRSSRKIGLVSHDAHPHGAQYLALHIVKELVGLGFDVFVVLLGPGLLEQKFGEYAAVHRAEGDAGLQLAASWLSQSGVPAAIVNTTVSGRIIPSLMQEGLRTVSLIHEMPKLIASYRLEQEVAAITASADMVVFSSECVKSGFPGSDQIPAHRNVVRPQGLFKKSKYIGISDLKMARRQLRHRLNIPLDSKIVLAVGYGDFRKGLDIFGNLIPLICENRSDVHFVWVGHFDESLMSLVQDQLTRNGMENRFHPMGMDFETDDYYAGADVYALTSREDPFPCVVLEALAVGLPVVAFEASGGATDVLSRGCGMLVAGESPEEFARAVGMMLEDPDSRRSLGAIGSRLVAEEFDFSKYVQHLVTECGISLPRVSVVVPNYNYAHLLHGRLQSISSQTLPPHEVIVLDDASTDDSLSVLEGLRSEIEMDFTVVAADRNSGSVFRQWLKGVQKASGEYIWIAEADDLSDPAFLALVVDLFENNPTVCMAYCQSSAIDSDGSLVLQNYLSYTDDIDVGHWQLPYAAYGGDEVNLALAVKNTIPNVSAVIFRRDALLSVLEQHIDQICEFKVAGDWVAYLLLLQSGKIAYRPEVLNVHRRHVSSVTSSLHKAIHLEEISKAQHLARKLYNVDFECKKKGEVYISRVRSEFGLD